MKSIRHFLADEDGAITIEWVALAAGVVVLALGMVSVLEQPLEDVTSSIAVEISSVVSSQIAE